MLERCFAHSSTIAREKNDRRNTETTHGTRINFSRSNITHPRRRNILVCANTIVLANFPHIFEEKYENRNMLNRRRKTKRERKKNFQKGTTSQYLSERKSILVQIPPVKIPIRNLLWDNVSFAYSETKYAQR
jgi:hypothetical protein